MAARGKAGKWESHSAAKVPAPANIAARLGVAEGELCIRARYEFLAESKPAQLSTSWEAFSITGGTVVVLPEGGAYAKNMFDRQSRRTVRSYPESVALAK